jgi:predicted transcriptional regulator
LSTEIDSILLTIENPVRRRIIKRLSQEPSYQLQLSKELGFSQQLVAKHLDAMEDVGMVASSMEESPRGPKRKEYLLNKSVSVTLDFAPNLFRVRALSFDTMPEAGEVLDTYSQFTSALNETLRYPEERGKLRPFTNLVNRIDRRLKTMEDEKSVLICVRNLAMREVARTLNRTDAPVAPGRVLHEIIEKHDESVEGISKSLDMREATVRGILEDLQKDIENRES